MDVAFAHLRSIVIIDAERIEVALNDVALDNKSQLIGSVKLRHDPVAWTAGRSKFPNHKMRLTNVALDNWYSPFGRVNRPISTELRGDVDRRYMLRSRKLLLGLPSSTYNQRDNVMAIAGTKSAEHRHVTM